MIANRLAVDFGTTHTVALISDPRGHTRTLLFDGSPLLPSAVFAAEDGHLHVGVDAIRLASVDPAAFEPNPKARIDESVVLLGQREVPVPDLIAAVMARVVEEAGRAAVGPIAECVLTHPAAWGVHRRKILADGASRAGLSGLRFLAEPVAAATYFSEVLGHRLANGQQLAVFDFGGGTLDVAIVACGTDGLAVAGVGGLCDLGGRDLDAAAAGVVGAALSLRDPAAWHRFVAPRTIDDHHDRVLLWQETRQAKEMLSRAPIAPVHVPGQPGGVHLTRDEFERAIAPLIDRAVSETAEVLSATTAAPTQLAGLFLVGGTSRVPMVAQQLHRRLGLAPIVLEQPETVVAAGAIRWNRQPTFTPPPSRGVPPVTAPTSPLIPPPPDATLPSAAPLSSSEPSSTFAASSRRKSTRGRTTAIVAATVMLISAIASATAAWSLRDEQPAANTSLSAEDHAKVISAAMPVALRPLAEPWLPLLQDCEQERPNWTHGFANPEPTSGKYCKPSAGSLMTEHNQDGLALLGYLREDYLKTNRDALQKAKATKIDPPLGIATAWLIPPGQQQFPLTGAECVIYWDIAPQANQSPAGAALMSTSKSACTTGTQFVDAWRTQVQKSR